MHHKDYIQLLTACPAGKEGWNEFEDLATEILNYLFRPALNKPYRQPRTLSGISRLDLVFPNKNITPGNLEGSKNWYYFYRELNARLILCEFKNYDKEDIGKDEVMQAANYLTEPFGKLALLVCNKGPVRSAYLARNSVYNNGRKVILFITKEHLIEMLQMKERGEEPSDLLFDLLNWFYLELG